MICQGIMNCCQISGKCQGIKIITMSGNFTFQSSKSLDVWSGCCFLVLFCSALCVGTLYNAVVIYWDREWRVGETFLYAEHTMKNLLEQENTCSSDSDQAGN